MTVLSEKEPTTSFVIKHINSGFTSLYEVIASMKPRDPLCRILNSPAQVEHMRVVRYVPDLSLKKAHEYVHDQHFVVRENVQPQKYRELGRGGGLSSGDYGANTHPLWSAC